jgi:ABC-2 type transport system ATP-binding protein
VPVAVEIRELTMRYGDTTAVDGLSLDVATGSITAILGPNGAGKTTTIETCEGFRTVQSGSVKVLGLNPQDRVLRPRVGVMLQSGGAWVGARAGEMLRHIAALHETPLPWDDLVERLGMGAYLSTPYRRLSGGQQQTLSLAMAVIGRPELLFLDEPSAGLDPQARRNTWSLMSELRESGVTIVLTTHFMDEAQTLADQVFVVDAGRVIAGGAPTDLTGGPETEYVVTDLNPSQRQAFIAWCGQQGLTPTTRTKVGNLEETFLELTGKELR